MKITQDVSEYAKEQNLEAEKALAVGMAEKAAEFKAMGSGIYQGNVLIGAKEHNYPVFGDKHGKISNVKDLYI